MAARGLVEKRADTDDRRRTFVHITAAGWAAVGDLMIQAREIDAGIAGEFGGARQARLKGELEALIVALEGHG
jgi:DNA-binding MarR family transcriptional regulator